MNKRKIILMSIALTLSASVWAGGKKKQVFIPMDYSSCGYHASEGGIPDVRNAVAVGNTEGDCSLRLQRAIDYVSQLKPDKNGHRGTVLIGEGTFHLDHALRISTSGARAGRAS